MSLRINFLKAGRGDSIWISFKDQKEAIKNILLDGGVSETYYDSKRNLKGALHDVINGIKDRGEYIDLLVLSHIDNDHIGGLLQWFERDPTAYQLIKNIWFNSGKSIAGYYKEPNNKDLDINLKDHSESNTGVTEALVFEEYLLKHKIWNKALILQGESMELGGARIQVLTPTPIQLKKLLREYKQKTGEVIYTDGKNTDWKQDLKIVIGAEKDDSFRFIEDSSLKNGSSITILLTYNNLHYLFLADSHPKSVSKALRELGYTHEQPLEAALLQISHHGSKANNNRDLLNLVKTDHYVISTDSSSSGHPHKTLLGRIIDINPSAIFYFNYEKVRDKVFTPNDYQDFDLFKTKLTEDYTTEL